MDYKTDSGIKISCKTKSIDYKSGINFLVEKLDSFRGMYLSSGTEYPGRYSRWEIGFINPPIEVLANHKKVVFRALNEKGKRILLIINEKMPKNDAFEMAFDNTDSLEFKIIKTNRLFSEEERSKQPTAFSPLREIFKIFKIDDEFLGFYGAFGYDLLFEFEPISLRHKRDNDNILHLYLPDEIFVLDRRKEVAFCHMYDFSTDKFSTKGIAYQENKLEHKFFAGEHKISSNMSDEEYAGLVEKAKAKMKVGDVFELVLHREFMCDYHDKPSNIYKKMTEINPSPYQFYLQLGDMQLVGASPEMFVRVNGKRVETCPISGTIRRGNNSIEDSERIKTLLNSEKDEVELTMCTDVDRNDKYRVCNPDSVKLLGRRQIETYLGLFHTVDHVEGTLKDECDVFDAFLSHMWAVTLMGSPKPMASQLIEDFEPDKRGYYGGAVGGMLLNGNANTGITIRTIHLKDGKAVYPVGASLVFDSVGLDEAKETHTKANSFFKIMNPPNLTAKINEREKIGFGLKMVVVDNKDSFVNTLSGYFRKTGVEVVTYRAGVSVEKILEEKPDLVLHSPGPSRPSDFGMPELIVKLTNLGIPQFGVCLGLQGTVEAFSGELRVLDTPRQGKQWEINHTKDDIFLGISSPCKVGAYHSLVAVESKIPDCLEVIASTNEGLVMAVKHREKPIYAVQFHPESIMSMEENNGMKMIENVIRMVKEYKNKK